LPRFIADASPALKARNATVAAAARIVKLRVMVSLLIPFAVGGDSVRQPSTIAYGMVREAN
jgi:hypothetical protein